MPGTWMALVIVLWVVVILLAVMVLGLMRRLGRLERVGLAGGDAPGLLASDGPAISGGPAVGSSLPPVPAYETFSTTAALQDRKRLMLFVGGSCRACQRLARDLDDASVRARFLTALRDTALVLVTETDDADEFASLPAAAVLAARQELSSGWGVPGTPFAVAVDEHGMVCGSAFTSTTNALCEVAATLA